MNLIRDDIHHIYRAYLVPTLGSALALSVYSFVDTIAVGQYAGSLGTAAIAVINPVYTYLYIINMLFAAGGSVRLGHALGRGRKQAAMEYFSAAVTACLAVTLLSWLLGNVFRDQILLAFGADQEILPVVSAYGQWIFWFMPLISLPDFLGAFLRMDQDPRRAMHAVMAGGLLNMFLGWYLVFPCGMGVSGAGLATVLGTVVQNIWMLTHFVSKKNHLQLVRCRDFFQRLKEIVYTGFSAILLDIGNIVVVVALNRMMLTYGGREALGVYGVLNTITMLTQALYAGIGQTIQPAVSVNFGASQKERVCAFYQLALRAAMLMGIVITLVGELFPRQILFLFNGTSGSTAASGAVIVRWYMPAFLFLGVNVLNAYYLQSILKRTEASWAAASRSLILPLVFLAILHRFLGAVGVYLSIPLSELFTAVPVTLWVEKQNASLV